MPIQKRGKCFDEEERCFSKEEALKEAKRCKLCKDAPCEKGSPLGLPIIKLVEHIRSDKLDKAYAIVKEVNPFPKTSSKIIDAYQCSEKACKLESPIQIRRLQNYVTEHGKTPSEEKVKKIKKHIGIVGSGPAGLSCAAELSKKGYEVTVYEALAKQGGHLTISVPSYKLPRNVYAEEIAALNNVHFQNNVVVGKTIHLKELKNKHDAIFLALGVNTPQIFPFPGIEKGNVFTGHDLLMRLNHFKAHEGYDTPLKIGKNVVVLGGSELAVDTARSLRRLGANVSIIFEHGYNQMQAHHESLRRAQEENVQFIFLTQVEKLIGNKDVNGIECIQMMSHTTESGDNVLTPIDGGSFTIPCDQVYLATSQYPTIFSDPEIKIRKSRTGKPIVNQHLQTTEDGIFAGGEMRLGKVSLEETIADGKKGAKKIDLWLQNALKDEEINDELF